MAEFAFGVAFGAVLVLFALVVFVMLVGMPDDDDDDDDEWNPWGRGA